MRWLSVANSCSANVKPIAKIVEKYHKPPVFIKIICRLNFCLSSFNVFPPSFLRLPHPVLPVSGAPDSACTCVFQPVGKSHPRLHRREER